MRSTATPNLLQSLPPISVSPRNPSLLAHSSLTSPPKRTLDITCASKRSPDDYHATLKALNSRDRRPRKSLGQHYMLNDEINEQLVASANVEEGDLILEIGPGTGSLTNVLIDAGATVLAIEKDAHMAALVRERFADTNRFKVLQEDFIKCHIRSHMLSMLESMGSLSEKPRYAKVVANIPFNISTDVIKQLLPTGDIFSEIVLLLQDETALRLVESSLRTSEYRPINIFVNFYSDPEYKFKVPRSNFFPQPKVDAAVVRFKLKQAVDYPVVSSTKSFFSMVNSAFNGKRKMLRKSLQHICTPVEIEEALQNVGCLATSRPEELTLDDFVNLHNSIVRA
uniref:rRNA adenine N(6)-methyltransferase n=1 Tax=Populus trichocarpa TaxID=3694 RepID=A0A2K1XS24_POPTR|eukprot:XP_024440101.1 ribosomal RNA small subunit methyltransferase, chloroplastic [Populus trichocarpa]